MFINRPTSPTSQQDMASYQGQQSVDDYLKQKQRDACRPTQTDLFSIDGTSNTTNNCWQPYYPPTLPQIIYTTSTSKNEHVPAIAIDRVSNGWIVTKDGHTEAVATTYADLLLIIRDHFDPSTSAK